MPRIRSKEKQHFLNMTRKGIHRANTRRSHTHVCTYPDGEAPLGCVESLAVKLKELHQQLAVRQTGGGTTRCFFVKRVVHEVSAPKPSSAPSSSFNSSPYYDVFISPRG